MQKRIGKVVVVNSNNEVLLIKRGDTAPSRPLTWETPGGYVDKGESVEEGSRRELFEETAIKAGELKELYSKRMPWGDKRTFYYYEVDEVDVKISWEHSDYRWHPIDRLHEIKDLPNFYRLDLEKALSQAGKI